MGRSIRAALTTAGLAIMAGCAQQAADPVGVSGPIDPAAAADAAASPPELTAVADAMAAQAGQQIGAGLTLTGARAEGETLALDLRHDNSAAEFTPASRDAFVFTFDRDFGRQMCAAPATRAFVEERGGVRATIVTQDGQPLATRLIDGCDTAA